MYKYLILTAVSRRGVFRADIQNTPEAKTIIISLNFHLSPNGNGII